MYSSGFVNKKDKRAYMALDDTASLEASLRKMSAARDK